MEALQNRIDSYSKAKRVKQPGAKSSATVTLKWPHPSHFKATPQSLAEAGFYFNPSHQDRDSVACYLCGKELSDWAEDDDPFDIHWNKCAKDCSWASVRCGLRGDMDRHGRYVFTDKSRLPSCKAMEKARLATFTTNNWWPHDEVRNHGATSTKMAQAGFVYSPQYPGDDLASCLYCNISLSGWDEDDDPLEEHRKREQKSGVPCPFFSVDPPATAQPATKPASKSTTSKPSSRTTTSKTPASKSTKSKPKPKPSADLFEPTKNDEDERDESDSIPPATAAKRTAKTPRKPRSTASTATKTPRTITRSKSRANLHEEDEEDIPPPATVLRKVSKSKAKAKEVVEDESGDEVEEPPMSRKVSRAKPKANIVDEDEEQDAQPPSRAVSRKASKSHHKPKAIDETEEEDVIEAPPPPRPAPVPRKASKSQAKPKVIEDLEDGLAQRPPTVPRKASKLRSKKADTDLEKGDVDTPPPPTSRKPSKSQAKPNSKAVGETGDMGVDVPRPPTAPRKVSSKSRAPSSKVVTEGPQKQADVPRKASGSKAGAKEGKPEENIDSAPSPESNPNPKAALTEDEGAIQILPVKSAARPVPLSRQPSVSRAQGTGGDRVKVMEQGRHASDAGFSAKQLGIKVVEISTDEEDGVEYPDQGVGGSSTRGNATSTLVSQTTKMGEPAAINPGGDPYEARSGVEPDAELELELEPIHQLEKGEQKNHVFAEVVRPPSQVRDDVQMSEAQIEESTPDQEQEGRRSPPLPHVDPSTPPRPATTAAKLATEPVVNDVAANPILPSASFPFFPPLATLPFQKIESLTETELDMTVEEWIRYQMGIEYEKFKEDGERELKNFKQKAEEVRRTIEAL